MIHVGGEGWVKSPLTLPETNSLSPLKMDGTGRLSRFLLGFGLFSGATAKPLVSGRVNHDTHLSLQGASGSLQGAPCQGQGLMMGNRKPPRAKPSPDHKALFLWICLKGLDPK